MNLLEFTRAYRSRFKAAGGDPDLCSGVLWTEDYCSQKPDATVADFVRMVDRKIEDGSADHGWLLSALRFNWQLWSEAERIECIGVLAKRGAHKALLNPALFKERLTDLEAADLERELRRTGNDCAADRLVRERGNG